MLEGAVQVSCSETLFLSALQIVVMGGDHQNLAGFEIEQFRYETINRRVGFVVADILSRQNAIPGQAGVFSHIGQKRDVAVGKRSNHEAGFEPFEFRQRIGPGLEAVPNIIEVDYSFFPQPIDIKTFDQFIQYHAVERVELGPR